MAFYQQQPFYNPKIPFTGSIQGGLQNGKSIIVSGRVLPGANRFHVNLQCGSRSGADVALHFNPRYDSSSPYVVTNTYQGSKWGSEERTYQAPIPAGSPFTLMILAELNSYKISLNGAHLMEYRHRLPFTMVDTIFVDGMVEVNSIAFQNPPAYFPPQPGFPTPIPAQPAYVAPAYGAPPVLTIPYKTIISGGLYMGKNITINGMVNPDAKRFTFNLRCGNDIALHYNPRFDENVVVRNSHLRGSWGSEERTGSLPFYKGQPFMVTISCNPHHYNIFVNGNQVHTYSHRVTNLHEITVLEVDGHVTLTSVVV
ncbi:galectin-9-like [Chanos chanos]|uniref:Galectin n=1 Tax=Chanos chanos TaxID=29144 RepID=A0A6J2VML5_CHACN|nr:galectin-9 [Chanos chanos]